MDLTPDQREAIAGLDPETLHALGQLDVGELQAAARVGQLVGGPESDRRAVLKALAAGTGAGALAGGGYLAATETAQADASSSDGDGDIGQPGDRVDVFADAIDMGTPGGYGIQPSGAVDALDVNSETGNSGVGVAIHDNGTKLYVYEHDGTEEVHSYSLSTAYDLSTASTENSLDVSARDSSPQGIDFGDGGSKMYLVGNGSDDAYEYDLSTEWDISTASFNQSADISSGTSTPEGISVTDGGSKMFITTGNDAHRFDLSTDWDVSTASSPTGTSLDLNYLDPPRASIGFNPDGTKAYWLAAENIAFVEFELSTEYDLSSRSLNAAISCAFDNNESFEVKGFAFAEPDESFFALTDMSGTDIVWEYPRRV